jgi:hypothetical protein
MATTSIRLAAEKLVTEYPHAAHIARAVGVNDNVGNQTVAGAWLLGLRDSLIDNLERILTADYPQDEVNDLESTPVSSQDQWQVWLELRLWEMDPDTAVMDHGEFPKPYPSFSTESLRAVKFSDIPDLAKSYEWEVASNALNIMLQDAQTAYGEYDDESE